MPCLLSEVPVIKEHPRSCSVQLGKDCKLFCYAVGKHLRYRWYKRSIPLDGETSSVLHIRKADVNAAGRYSCIVANGKGSVVTWATIDVVSIISSPKIR